MDKNYWAIHMGTSSSLANLAYDNGFIAIGWNEFGDLAVHKTLDQRQFIERLNPEFDRIYPDESKGRRGQTIGQLFRFSSLVNIDDIIVMPKLDEGKVYVGKVTSDYYFDTQPIGGCEYHHRRRVKWVKTVESSLLSQGLRNSIGSIMTFFNISNHAEEIDSLLNDVIPHQSNGEINDVRDFGMESHLEDFIIENWDNLKEFSDHEIYSEDGQIVGQQFVTPIGRIDILARSKDGNELLVIELKKGKTADYVVGQALRYMGWIKENMTQNSEQIRGIIISGDTDEKLKYAISMVPSISHYTYKVNFELLMPSNN